MNESTEGVTLLAGFVLDVIGDHADDPMFAPLVDMAQGVHRDRPQELVPMQLYNNCCSWIEDKLGSASIRRAGVAIGDRAFDAMRGAGKLGASSTPAQVVHALKWAADTMIQDPEERGWEIIAEEPRRIRMRRTQTFNCMLQEGLLVSLLRRSDAKVPNVEHAKCTRRGDEFCEYELRWL